MDELQCQPPAQIIADRHRQAEDHNTDRFSVVADRLIAKLDVACTHLQWLIANSGNVRVIGSQIEDKFYAPALESSLTA